MNDGRSPSEAEPNVRFSAENRRTVPSEAEPNVRFSAENRRTVPSEAEPNVRFSAENRRTVIWCPDWPVYAAGATRMSAAAVFDKGQVLACTDIARHDGVRRGMRKRDAQSRCPQLELF